MTIPLKITFRGLERSDAVEARIAEKVQKLVRLHPRITSCHVVVDQPHRHHHAGGLYDVHIDVVVPGAEIVVNREPGKDHSHEDVFVALRDAFAAVTRKLDSRRDTAGIGPRSG